MISKVFLGNWQLRLIVAVPVFIMTLCYFDDARILIAEDLPPIECPLRKAGIDKTKLKPFEEVGDYISFLEREDRAIWQQPDAVVEALGLAGDEVVADVGAGSGYFTFRLAQVVVRPQNRYAPKLLGFSSPR